MAIIFALLMLVMAGAVALAALAVPLMGIAIVIACVSIGAFFFVFWIWMLVDCIKNDRISDTEKIVWALVIVFTHWLGALIYFFAARSRQKSIAPQALATA